jgi:ADP-ribose pyrophosphatase YjhB (NUDIX family)
VQKAKGDGQVAGLQVADSEIHHVFVVAALIRREDEILLIRQQGRADAAPYWSLPGGVVEVGEAVTAAVIREAREECGLIADAVGPLAYATWIEHGPMQRTTALIYEIDAWTGEIVLTDPDGLVLNAAFFPPDAALDRVCALPYRSMREPLLAYLTGEATAGSVWFYTGEEVDPRYVSPAEAIPWQDLTYLTAGMPRQRAAFVTLQRLQIMDALAAYTPTLIGTLPLDVETAQSDLDIACFAPDLDEFAATVTARYGDRSQFRLNRKWIRGVPSVIASFDGGDFDLQLFAQPQPVLAQYGYRHLLVEARLLSIGSEADRQAIRRLKESGVKTEPAFARHFGIDGDPYEALWTLSLGQKRD